MGRVSPLPAGVILVTGSISVLSWTTGLLEGVWYEKSVRERTAVRLFSEPGMGSAANV